MGDAVRAGGTVWSLLDLRIQNIVVNSVVEQSSPSAELSGILVPVACKTGTAEFGDSEGKTHAWFTVYAPLPDDLNVVNGQTADVLTGTPEIVLTVLLEEAGEGSAKAAPIAKEILEYWFSR